MVMSRKAWFSTRRRVGGTGSAASSGFLFRLHAPASARVAIMSTMVTARRPFMARHFPRPSRSIRMDSSAMPAAAGRKSYDEAYFRKWYRDPRTRVHTPDSVRRKVRMVLGVTEYFLGRKLRTVLDVGAGEGTWGAELGRLRPGLRYLGLDPSEYVVERYGRRRNIKLGSFQQ